jgi:hypothetical protein
MDGLISAAAALIGAAIGGAVSLLASVITHRHERTLTLRAEQRAEIDAFNRAAADLLMYVSREGWDGTRRLELAFAFNVAQGRLLLLIPSRDVELKWIIEDVGEVAGRKDLEAFAFAFDACADVLIDWYRLGERDGVRAKYEQRITEARDRRSGDSSIGADRGSA